MRPQRGSRAMSTIGANVQWMPSPAASVAATRAARAAGDQIVAIPTLVRKLPEPLRRIVGDLSNTEKTLVGLQIRPANPDT